MPNWRVVRQEVTSRGVTSLVKVRLIKYRPGEDKETGERKFFKLKHPIVQVCINLDDRPDADEPIRLRYKFSNDGYEVLWPDRERPKLITVGAGKKKRVALDRLDPEMVTHKGESEQFPNLATFERFCFARFGRNATEYAIRLITNFAEEVRQEMEEAANAD